MMKKSIFFKSTIVASLILLQGCGGGGGNTSVGGGGDTSALIPENEPYYTYLWHLNAFNSPLNGLGYPVDSNADIHIETAWNTTKGAGIKVAVIDEGFDTSHEDLKSNIIATYNADDGSSNVQYYGIDGAHGSTCAGFIAAPVNKTGIVGVAPESKLILIKQDLNNDAATIRAFEYAKSQGAKVISCSWGTSQVSQAVEDEFKSIYNSGITIVFASGNNGSDLDTDVSNDESESPWVIGVGASGENNDVTSYSDYGNNIDLIAPGGDKDLSSGVLGLDDMGFFGSDEQKNIVNNNYSFHDGTSFACPIVAGTAALMYSVNPNLTPQQIRSLLIETTDKIGATQYGTNGFDVTKRRGYGKVNVTKAVNAASF